MRLESGRDIRAERARRGVAIGWLAKNANISEGELRAIERNNLPLSEEVKAKVRQSLESVSCAA